MSNIPDDVDSHKQLFNDRQEIMKQNTRLEQELVANYQLINELRQERQILIDMIKDIRKAFYVDGTTKAMRETMNKHNNPFKILLGEFPI